VFEDDDDDEVAVKKPPTPYWGIIGTLAFTFGIFLAFGVTWEIGASFVTEAGFHRDDFGGLHFMAGYTTGMIGGLAFMVMLIRIRRTVSVADYLDLRRPPIGATLLCLVIMGAVVALVQAAGAAMDLDMVYAPVRDNLATALIPLLYVLVTALVVPVFDTAFFQGFLLKGLAESRLGMHGAAAISTLVWTVMQIPSATITRNFDVASLQTIEFLLVGALLAYARLRWKSLILCGIVCSAWNLITLFIASR